MFDTRDYEANRRKAPRRSRPENAALFPVAAVAVIYAGVALIVGAGWLASMVP